MVAFADFAAPGLIRVAVSKNIRLLCRVVR